MSESKERWLPVPRYEGLYEVSDLGQVRSLDRYIRGKYGSRFLRGRVLHPGSPRNARRTVSLCRDGERETRLVGNLVLEAFVSPRPVGQVIRHGRAGGGALNDSLDNLEWGTPEENMGADCLRDGTDRRGEKCGMAKLTAAIVTEMRIRYLAGETVTSLAAEFGVSESTASNAITGKRWSWLPGAVPIDNKRRGKQGENHHAAKLTAEIVRECRIRYAAGETTYALAEEFGVKQPTMQKAISGKTWKNI